MRARSTRIDRSTDGMSTSFPASGAVADPVLARLAAMVPQGWGMADGERKAHYFDAAGISLCNGQFYAGSLTPDRGALPGQCRSCRRQVDALRRDLEARLRVGG